VREVVHHWVGEASGWSHAAPAIPAVVIATLGWWAQRRQIREASLM
jgi:hypothetical protein